MIRRSTPRPVGRASLKTSQRRSRLRQAIVEALEGRQLLSITSASISAPAHATEGSACYVSLWATCTGGPSALSGWSINWGDGGMSEWVMGNATSDSHVYASPSALARTISATVYDNTLSTATATGTVVVDPAPLNVSSNSGTYTAGVAQSRLITPFVDGNAATPAADFTANISWGDGTSGSGTVVSQGGGSYGISASHAYATAGSDAGTVTVVDSFDGVTTAASYSVYVTDPINFVSAGGGYAPFVAGENLLGVVIGTFTDNAPGLTAGNFQANISWGDNSASIGTVVGEGGGVFEVVAGHMYASAGSYSGILSVTAHGASGASSYVNSNGFPANVGNAPIIPVTGGATYTAGESQSGTVATFSDGNTLLSAADFTASISWGDSTSSTGTVTAQGNGTYGVAAAHLYASAGSYSSRTTVHDDHGDTGIVPYYNFVNNAISNGSGIYTAGERQSGAITTFTDGNTLLSAADFTAGIAWGDGSSSVGTITALGGGNYGVAATHQYAAAGTDLGAVTVHDDHAMTGGASYAATVTNAPIVLSGGSGVYTEGASLSSTIATFTDGNTLLTAADFTATVSWGDGSSSPGVVVSQGQGSYGVAATPTFAEEGLVNGVIGVNDHRGTAATATYAATVADAPLTAAGQSPVAVVGVPFSGVLATFTDADPNGNIADYSATITWSDGTMSAGAIGPHGAAGWSVTPSLPRTFAVAGISVATVHIADAGGAYTTANGYITTAAIHLEIDSDNNDGTGLPANTAAEIADHLIAPGKVVGNGPTLTPFIVDLPAAGNMSILWQLRIKSGLNKIAIYTDAAGLNPVAMVVDPNVSSQLVSPSWSLQTANSKQTFYIKGLLASLNPGDGQLSAQVLTTGPSSAMVVACSDDALVTVDTADLVIDSLNQDGNSDPVANNTPAIEALKNNSSLPGKVIIANTLDSRGANLPGYADFTTGIGRTPFDLLLPKGIDLTKATITFNYASADPSLLQTTPSVGADIPAYFPGSNGFLRIWDSPVFGNKTSIVNGGAFIPGATSIALSSLPSVADGFARFWLEGVNPTDPRNTEIKVDMRPFGSSALIVNDAVRVTVATLDLVYTDVTGLTHGGTPLNVNRIAANLQPDGTATDWMNNVDDGSVLLVSVVASPALASVANGGDSMMSIGFGEIAVGGSFAALSPNDGILHPFDDGFIPNAAVAVAALGIPLVGGTLAGVQGANDGTVLAEDFYRPPNEFNLAAASVDFRIDRRVPLAIQFTVNNNELAMGGKPTGLMLTRPPLVLVHGINSSPGVWSSIWSDSRGGASFISAMQGYATPLTVDDRGVDVQRPLEGSTSGYGELADMWINVALGVATAVTNFHTGCANFDTNPYTGLSYIADQKVDVVGHSYGGLLTRWYMEQSNTYGSLRNIRKCIELGTPNQGAPLTNLIDEIYANPTIGNALAEVSPSVIDAARAAGRFTLTQASANFLPNSLIPGTSTPREFFSDASVGSSEMLQLATNPFSPDVRYAAVVGTNPNAMVLIGTVFPPVTTFETLNLYQALQPMTPDGGSLFPWLSSIDPASDSVVPKWSASLGVSAYNFDVNVDHTHLVQDAAVQQQVLTWLNNPNIPLGSAQRAAYQNQVPLSDQNAYIGWNTSAIPPTRGGLNPKGIVGVKFNGAAGLLNWDTQPADVGIHTPIFTGMIQYGEIPNADFQVLDVPYYANGTLGPTVDSSSVNKLDAFDNSSVTLTISDLALRMGVPVNQVNGATWGTWVTFAENDCAVGRTQAQQLTGPLGVSAGGLTQYLTIRLSGEGGDTISSPFTVITVPAFVLPAPTLSGLVVSPLNPAVSTENVTLSGAVECTAGGVASQTTEVDLYQSNTFSDTKLCAISVSVNVLGRAWAGLLIGYTAIVGLVYTNVGGGYYTFGSVAWNVNTLSEPISTQVQIYQWLVDPAANNQQSAATSAP